MAKECTLFTELLSALDVKHTAEFSNTQYRDMPFQSLFGLEKLLKEYRIDSCCFKVSDNKQLLDLPTPYLVQISNRFYIAETITSNNVSLNNGVAKTTMRCDEFIKQCSGIAMGVYPTDTACEPHYLRHRIVEIGTIAKRWLLMAITLFLFTYLFIVNGIYSQVSTVLLTIIDCVGLYFSYLLILKQLRIHTRAADRVCGVIQKEGCNKVLNTDASSFFGLFHWCEVGFAYFFVSLSTLLVFPQFSPQLAIINICCLPFTFWSIWYQHFKAKAWCTLCVSIQCMLWLQFFCYLFGGHFHNALPLTWNFFVLGSCYVAALLLLNKFLPAPNYEEENNEI